MYKEQLLTVGAADWIMGRFTEFRNMVGNSRHEAEIMSHTQVPTSRSHRNRSEKNVDLEEKRSGGW